MKLLKHILICFILIIGMKAYGQPLGNADFPVELSFRFFDRQNNVIAPDSKGCVVKFKFPTARERSNDSVIYKNGYFRCESYFSARGDVECILGIDTMRISVDHSIDSIPFIKGNYYIPDEFGPLFSVILHNGTKIIEQDFNIFNVKNKTSLPSTSLSEIKCGFWADRKKKIPIDFKPTIDELLIYPKYSSALYARDYHDVYVSEDDAENWVNIVKEEASYEFPFVTFKNKDTLLLFRRKFFKTPEVSISNDGGKSWQIDSNCTKMGFYFMGFNKNEGFAYAIRGPKEHKEIKTVFYLTKDGGRTWQIQSEMEGELYPTRIVYWEGQTIVVKSNWYCISYDGGKSWTEERSFHTSEDIYPMSEGQEFSHCIKRVDNKNKTIEGILTINDDWYVKMATFENVWCVCSQSCTLISKDYGKTWHYYFGGFGGSYFFTILNKKYLFDGHYLYLIP